MTLLIKIPFCDYTGGKTNSEGGDFFESSSLCCLYSFGGWWFELGSFGTA